MAKEWDYNKNGSLLSKSVTYGSDQKVWWICSEGHSSFQATISNRCNGKGCPYCSNTKVLKGYNDLSSQYPDIAAEWNYQCNIKLPIEYCPQSNQKVWWKCSVCGYEWQASIANRSKGRGCPMCAREANSKSKEKNFFQYSIYGEYLKEYESIKLAQYQTGIKSILPSSSSKKTSGGFIWLLQRNDDQAMEIASKINPSRMTYKRRPVLQYSLEGKFIKRYESAGKAERLNSISRSKVGECCRGKRKTAGGYI